MRPAWTILHLISKQKTKTNQTQKKTKAKGRGRRLKKKNSPKRKAEMDRKVGVAEMCCLGNHSAKCCHGNQRAMCRHGNHSKTPIRDALELFLNPLAIRVGP